MNAPESPRHILVLNNSTQVLALFRNVLEAEGFRVTTARYEGQDFGDIIVMKPDLIILDYMWSTDDDRWSLLQLLRLDPRTVTIPVILCTGAVREVEALRNHLEMMRVRILLKPFDLPQMLAVVAVALQPDAPDGTIFTSA